MSKILWQMASQVTKEIIIHITACLIVYVLEYDFIYAYCIENYL